MNIDEIMASPLLPDCYKENPHPDQKAMEWVVSTIERINTGNWQTTSARREKARQGYTDVFNEDVNAPVHQQYNIRVRKANLRLRQFVDRFSGGGSISLPMSK